ncbi:YIP1 family protein [Siccirubricoccus sp. KC 17139]|uniref:YIP1 family protein n=1 Tax=Siccirubricoccus soli TaxID=2899147 RepID=A0ABT1D856_9PROT|nr:Yip1 family protein [Siccirubricoccus soli]MCO6417445.1 YIP1 family protein [Siccirubricoccus soli]MCP2683580.1 YIP1 family protein [Siccirubricoccus soli]
MDIVARAKGLITRPAAEWAVIAAEPADTKSLFMSYAVPLSAIPAVAGFIGSLLFARMLGGMVGGLGVVFSPISLLLNAIAGYVLGLAGVWVWGKIIEAMAPRFGGRGDEVSAMKLAVYAPTAAWVAGIFALLPPLAVLGLLGLYSLYIFWKGVPVVVGVPEDRRLAFTAAVIVIGFLLNLLAGMFAGMFLRF